jgi:hypothetical protein
VARRFSGTISALPPPSFVDFRMMGSTRTGLADASNIDNNDFFSGRI